MGSNLPELTRPFPVSLLPPSSQGFEEVRCGSTAPTLPCSPAFPFFTVLRGGSNLPKLTRTFPVALLPPSSQ